MMEAIHDFVTNNLFGLEPIIRDLLIFLFSFGEGLPIIGSFLPGGTIALLVGSLAQEGFVNAWLAITIIALGSFCGDIVGYYAGKKLGNIPAIKKKLEDDKHASKWDLFDRHAALVIILGKVLPVVRSTPALFAGAKSFNLGKYSVYVLIGSFVWAAVGIFGGGLLAQIFGKSAVPILLGALIVTGIIAFVAKTRKSKKETQTKKIVKILKKSKKQKI